MRLIPSVAGIDNPYLTASTGSSTCPMNAAVTGSVRPSTQVSGYDLSGITR
jgi:hypothetical protein